MKCRVTTEFRSICGPMDYEFVLDVDVFVHKGLWATEYISD